MTAGKWFSQPDSDKPTFGHFDMSMVDDDFLRSILERINFELAQLNRGCEVAVPLRAQCWWPEVTPIRYGYYMASFNECVLSAKLTTGEGGTTRTVVLPDANLRPGGYVEVADKTGDAATTNITVKGVKGETINGSLTYTINVNSVVTQFRSDGANWMVVGQGPGGSVAGLYQPLDATLTALAAANWAVDNLPIGTGPDTLSQVAFAANTFPAKASTGALVAKTITDFALTILDDANGAAVRTTIGAGTGSGDVTAAANIADNRLVRGDGGAKGIQESPIIIDDSGNMSAIGTIASGAITSTGLIKSSSASAGIGYATGAGGTVTQITSKATAVTLDKICGTITMHTAALAAGATVAFDVNNTTVAATDVIIAKPRKAAGTAAASYRVQADTMQAGVFGISVDNISTGSLSEALEISFVVIKGVAA